LIKGLKNDGHYLGAHSDQHLLYCDWIKRDSLLVTREQFKQDLEANYTKMEAFGIRRKDAPYFLPAFEWYNSTIARWTREEGLQLVNLTPGTRSAADYTFPSIGSRYCSSDEIYRSIMSYHTSYPSGLNGFILLLHVGTDPQRTDKFYTHLDQLLSDLKNKGYQFVRIDQLLKQ
jgi:peptidoglycan/xylan/chitin deacetylase (PgdA/CDA1 family)